MARIIPTDDHGGAKEADTVEFVDRYLSGSTLSTQSPTAAASNGSRENTLKPGSNVSISFARKYVEGIQELDRRSEARFDAAISSS